MSPFDQNISKDAGQVIGQDDLIAFHLHELSPQQERAVQRVLQHNPALQSESLAIAAALRVFPKREAPFPLDAATLDRHWHALRPSLTAYVPPATVPCRLSNLQRWAIPTFAAAALAATAVIVALHHNQPSQPTAMATNLSPSPSALTPAQHSITAPGTTTPAGVITLNAYRARLDHSSPLPNPVPPTPLISPPTPPPTPAATTSAPSTSPSPEVNPSTTSTADTAPPGAPLVATAASQAPTTHTSPRRSSRTRHDHTSDITVAAFGNLTAGRSFTSTAGAGASAVTARYGQSTDPSIGVLASFHQQFRPMLGYRVTASYSAPSFQYTYSTAGNSTLDNSVHQHVTELSGSYVVESQRHHRISTAAEAGASLLVLIQANPNSSTAPVGNTLRPAAVVGASVEFALSRHWAIHTGYRALLYNAPAAYSTYGSTIPTAPNHLTLSSEPVVGFTYRFRPASE